MALSSIQEYLIIHYICLQKVFVFVYAYGVGVNISIEEQCCARTTMKIVNLTIYFLRLFGLNWYYISGAYTPIDIEASQPTKFSYDISSNESMDETIVCLSRPYPGVMRRRSFFHRISYHIYSIYITPHLSHAILILSVQLNKIKKELVKFIIFVPKIVFVLIAKTYFDDVG
ncbi:hypothetical protein BDA99DRAFT_585562 [Phascolomyces articulosus]|uniref:Uncharacterized protein n=1 Tax=Phascolomyces articulosus TaxID=60185 RepID=A0AAD5JVZ3_9FUNG|nr:hypothetical protein BDA99DRAFT_585562 [Phascolomyces articulosus]